MNKTFLLKVGASLLAVFLMTACNNPDDTEQEDIETEENAETEETDIEENTDTEEAE